MRSPARLDAPTGNAARVTPPAQDDGRRSPNDVDESDPEQRALLDAENDMLAADLGSFASASVDDLAEDQEADIFLQVKDAIDTFLLYDFFVICVILLWLVVGVTYRVTVGGGLEVRCAMACADAASILPANETHSGVPSTWSRAVPCLAPSLGSLTPPQRHKLTSLLVYSE